MNRRERSLWIPYRVKDVFDVRQTELDPELLQTVEIRQHFCSVDFIAHTSRWQKNATSRDSPNIQANEAYSVTDCGEVRVMLVEAEGEGLEPPQACARRFSRPLQYHYASSPVAKNAVFKAFLIFTNLIKII